ncbi:MAG: hypothetical protein ACLSAS_08530 [Ruminococcus sp.]
MKIKKVQSVCLILACVAATGLIGCGKTDETSKKHEAITFMAPYLEVDSFIEEVHKTYPEVNLEVITYSGSNTTTYLQNMLEADDLPDICTQTFYKPDVVDVSDKMIDLSGYDFTDNYVESRLKEVSDEGALICFHLCTTVMESLIIKHCLSNMAGSCQHLLQSLKNLQAKQKKQELRYVWHRFSIRFCLPVYM